MYHFLALWRYPRAGGAATTRNWRNSAATPFRPPNWRNPATPA